MKYLSGLGKIGQFCSYLSAIHRGLVFYACVLIFSSSLSKKGAKSSESLSAAIFVFTSSDFYNFTDLSQ